MDMGATFARHLNRKMPSHLGFRTPSVDNC
jgi:hypothetical protein